MSAFDAGKKYTQIINLIKSRDNIPVDQFLKILRDEEFHINDFKDEVGDKTNFLKRLLLYRDFSKNTVEEVMIKASKDGDIANAEEVLKFFNYSKPPKRFDMNRLNEFIKIVLDVNSGAQAIENLEEIRIFLLKEINNTDPDSMFGQMYNNYATEFKEKYEDRPYEGKWTISFCEQVIDERNYLCTKKGKIYISGLSIIKTLADPTSPYLDNPIYIGFMEHILQFVLFTIGSNIMNLTPVAKALVRIINDSIGYEYVILNCKEGLGSYTCGRAITSIHIDKPYIPRLVIYNTISSADDSMDEMYYKKLITETDDKLNLDNGKESKYYSSKYNRNQKLNQEQNYYNKYLKYKLKYLQLKNK